MMRIAAKTMAIWIALLAGTIAGGVLIGMPAPDSAAQGPSAPDGPLSAGQALLIVNALNALVLAALAAHMTGPRWQKLIALFLVAYLVEALLSIIESWYFGPLMRLPAGMLGSWAAAAAIKAAVGAAVAAWLWRSADPPATLHGLAWKLPAVTFFYVVCYFLAGLAVWQSAAVSAYYGGGMDIDGGGVALLQLGRGALWTGLAWLLARHLRGTPLSKGLLAGAAFSLLMAGALLYPNALMPWPVRQAHLIEIAVSNFVFGLVAVWLLSSGRADAPRAAVAGV